MSETCGDCRQRWLPDRTGHVILCPKHDRSFEKRLVEALRWAAGHHNCGEYGCKRCDVVQALLREAEER